MSISQFLPRAFLVTVEPLSQPQHARAFSSCGWRACGHRKVQQQKAMTTDAVTHPAEDGTRVQDRPLMDDETLKAGVAAGERSPVLYRHVRLADFMNEMQRDIDAMFETFDIRPARRNFGAPFFTARPWRAHAHGPPRFFSPTSVSEDASAYTLKLEVPGFGKEDVKVTFDPSSNLVTIRGQKEAKEGESQSHTSFTRSFTVPETVDLNQEFKARTEHGVLTLELSKAPLPTPPPVKEIPVEGH